MLRLTLDMDDVLANTHEKLVDIVLNDFGSILTEKELHSKGLKELLHPKQLTRLNKIINTPGFFADIEVKKDAVETVHALSKFYEIFVATACMEFPNSFKDKFDWLHKHFKFIPWTNIVFCGDKSIINADYLIDDNVKHFKRFIGQGILFTAAHNRNVDWDVRVNSWDDVAKMLL